MRSERTKAVDIKPSVKKAVYKRDGGRCIICGSYRGQPNAHYIPRSAGGLGIEENIVTLCPTCHRAYDETASRKVYGAHIEVYLKSHYPEWDKEELIYRRK